MPNRIFIKLPPTLKKPTYKFYNWLVKFHELDRMRGEDATNPINNVLLPQSEVLTMPLIWACELYPPSYSAGLTDSIKRNGWKTGLGNPLPGDEIDTYLTRMREEPNLGWRVIGTILSRNSTGIGAFGAKREKLPIEFESIKLVFFSLGSALSAVVGTFHLSEVGMKRLEESVKGPHEPRVYRHGGMTHLEDRRFAGMSIVHNARQDLHTKARKWMCDNLPGVFAEEGDGRLPVADLLVRTGSTETFEYRRANRNYLLSLGLEEIVESDSDELPGLFLSEYRPNRSKPDERDVWSLSGEFETILKDDDIYFNGQRTMDGIAFGVDKRFSPLLTRLAMTSLLRLKMRRTAISRDAASKTYGRRPVHSSKLLRESLLRNSLDLLAIASEVKTLASDDRAYSSGVPEFRNHFARWLINQDQISGRATEPYNSPLLDELRTTQINLADSLVVRDSEARDLLGTVVTINSSIDSVRSQRWTLGFSILAVGIALLALFLKQTHGQ